MIQNTELPPASLLCSKDQTEGTYLGANQELTENSFQLPGAPFEVELTTFREFDARPDHQVFTVLDASTVRTFDETLAKSLHELSG